MDLIIARGISPTLRSHGLLGEAELRRVAALGWDELIVGSRRVYHNTRT